MFNNIEQFGDANKNTKVKKSETAGKGIFADQIFEKGDTIGLGFEKVSDIGTPDKDFRRTRLGKFINHSANPNLAIKKKDNKYYFIAKRRIMNNEELLINYEELNWEGNVNFDKNDLYLSEKGVKDKLLDIIEGTDPINDTYLNFKERYMKEKERDKTIDMLNIQTRSFIDNITDDDNYFRTIIKDYNIIGITGIVRFKYQTLTGVDLNRKAGTIITAINPRYRGNGYVEQAENMLAKELDLDDLYIVINRRNKPALKAYEKMGYERIPENLRRKLVNKDVLDSNDLMFVRHITPISDEDKEKFFYDEYMSESVMYSEAPDDDEDDPGDDPDEDQDDGDDDEEDETTDEESGDDPEEDEGGDPSGGDPGGGGAAGDDDVGDFDDDFEITMDEDEQDDDLEKRRLRYLETCFEKMYDKYTLLIEKLADIDVTKNKRVVLDKLVDKYKETLEMLIEYHNNTKDPVTVRYQTLLEFRILFINLNNKLHTFKDIVKENEEK